LYTRCHGEQFFEWLRQSVDSAYDVVLVDSRTGVTEMGSVCTRQLADAVVSFCAPNISNLHGVAGMAQSFVRDELLAARGRPLLNVIVPARVEMSEQAERGRFRDTFTTVTEPFLPPAFRENDVTFWGLRIPYVPFHAYREALTIGTSHSIEELADAYKNLAAALVLLAPARSPMYECCQPELSRILPLGKIKDTGQAAASALAGVLRRQLQHVFESIPGDRQASVLDILSRFLWIDPATGDICQRRVASAELHAAAANVQPFIDAGVLRAGRDGDLQSVGASDPLDLALWKPLRDWAADPANREFLLSRQSMQQLVQDWERAGRDEGTLMRGAALTRALRQLEERADSLTQAEQEFIRLSQRAHTAAIDRETRRHARARTYRRALAASMLIAAAALGGWYRYGALPYAMRAMQHEAAALLPQAPAKVVDAWTRALVLAGKYRDALDAAQIIREPSERAFALAGVAEAIAKAGSAEEAHAAADEAIDVALALDAPALVLASVAERLEAPMLRDRRVRAARLAVERHNPMSEEAIEATLSWGRILVIAGRREEAGASAREAIRQAQRSESPLERLNALTSLAAFPWDEFDEPFYMSSLRTAAAAFTDPLQQAYAWADVARAMAARSATAAAEAAAKEAYDALAAARGGPDEANRPVWLSKIAERLNKSGQRETAVTMAREAANGVRAVLIARSAVMPANNTGEVPPDVQEAIETLIRAAAVLALNDRFEETHPLVESVPYPATRATAWVSIAEQLKDAGRLNTGIEAAQMAADAAATVSGGDRSTLLLRAADVLAHLNRPDDARRLLQQIPANGGRATGKGSARSLAAALAEVWATIGEYQRARMLAEQASEADRLRSFAAILFEYSRHRDSRLASWLDPKRSSTE
jgi:hypothetical protein